MKSICLIAVLLALALAPTTASSAPAKLAAPAPLIVNPDGRTGVSLDGPWQVILDPSSSGDASPVAVGVEGSGFYQDRVPSSSLELIEYRFSDKVQLKVPGDWNEQRERLFFYVGPVWYKKTFAAPTTGGRHFLYFGAANYRADVYVNGRYVASHEGGFTPFNVEVTDRLRPGENLVVVKVDNTLGTETVPTRKTDWWNYGGLTRSVRLITVPTAHVRSYGWRLLDHRTRLIEVSVEADGAAEGARVDVSIPGLQKTAAIALDKAGRGRTQFVAPVALWSPETPRLYDVTVALGGTVVRDRIGFRTIATRGSDILLNGQPVFLKGIAMHEESVRHPGRSFGIDDARASLALVKRLNGNFVRLAHYPHDEATTRMADEMGLLVWSEIPVYWSLDWSNPAALATANAQLQANIERDRNRASIIIWSVGNETPMSAPRLAFMRALVGTVRAADSSRLVSAALLGDPFGFLRTYSQKIMAHVALDQATTPQRRAAIDAWFLERKIEPTTATLTALTAPTTHIVDDPLGDDIDIVAYNQYFGWYPAGFLARVLPLDEATIRLAEFRIMDTLTIEPRQAKPFIISEFGADAKRGFAGDRDTIFSEAFQVRYYRQQFRMLANSNRIRGIVPWVLKDFRTPLRTHPDYQEYFNRKGLVDERGAPKAAFDVLRDFYATIPPSAARGGGLSATISKEAGQ